MNYKDIKNYAARCDSHPDHQTGIVTNQMIMDRLHDEIEELRAYIEERRPLTDEDIAKLMADTWGSASIAPQAAPEFARAIEQAHGIGGEE
jgi:hypothetical protein